MATITYSSGTGIICNPISNRIPITFTDSLNKKLLIVTDTSFNLNIPIIKSVSGIDSTQLGGRISNGSNSLSGSNINSVVNSNAISLSAGVWYIQGSCFITYKGASLSSTEAFIVFWTQINTAVYDGNLLTASYMPSFILEQYGSMGAITYTANSVGTLDYSHTQILPISLVISLASTTNVYISGRTTTGAANYNIAIVYNAFRLG